MIISYDRRFVFIHIHKTGGDSVAAALSPALVGRDVALKTDVQQWMQRITPGSRREAAKTLGKHSSADEVRRYLSEEKWGQFYTFAFVRNPIDRTLSLYAYARKKAEEREQRMARNLWYLTPQGRATDPLRWPSVQAYRETATFSEFLRHPLLRSAPAMQPQWESLCDETRTVLVDFVGRFENLSQDFEVIARKLGVPDRSLPWRNSSGSQDGSRQRTIPNEDRALLVERFRDDFSLFGYDPEA